jgi:O-antigen ligase
MSNRVRRTFAFVAWLLPPIGVLSTQAVAVLGLLGALRLFAIREVRRGLRGEIASPLGLALCLGMLWATVACLWAPHPGNSLYLAARLAVIFVGGLAFLVGARGMDGEDSIRLQRTFCALAIAYLAFLTIEVAENGVVTRAVRAIPLSEPFNFAYLDRPAVVLALFAWPFAHAFYRRFGAVAAVLFLLLVGVCLTQTISGASRLALVLGAATFALVRWRPVPVLKALAVAVPLACLAMPPALVAAGTVTSHAPEKTAAALPKRLGSVSHRLLIWDFAVEKIAERPWLGWGFDASRALPGGKQHVLQGRGERMPLHPHNGLLQIWLELGAVGGVIAAGVAYAALRRLLALAAAPVAAAFAAALTVSFLTIAMISFGIWQNWWLATIWLAAGFAAVPIREEISAAGTPPPGTPQSLPTGPAPQPPPSPR